MKTLTAISILSLTAFISFNAKAIVRTVSNNPATMAQFGTIQDAVNASNNGDTVYVNGSSQNYTGFSLSKQLVILGPGWDPDVTSPLSAYVVNSAVSLVAGSSNSEFQGLRFYGTSINVNSGSVTNIRIIRNKFENNGSFAFSTQLTNYSGFVFEGNVFNSGSGIFGEGNMNTTYQNIVIRNNYFYSQNDYQIFAINSPLGTVLVDHNIFFGPSGNSSVRAFLACTNLLITNNVFVKRNAGANISSSTFNNNITYHPSIAPDPIFDSPWTVNGNVNAGGNISDQDPQMSAQASVNSGTNNPLVDFTIASGPANNTGSDGKDMGLLYDVTGSANWTNSRNSRLPRVYQMNITNPVIQSGGTINVNVEGRKSN